MAKINKNTVTATSQTTLNAIIKAGSKPKMGSTFPPITPRVTLTMCVRGKITMAPIWAAEGREVKGKNVPAKKIMGVMKRNAG